MNAIHKKKIAALQFQFTIFGPDLSFAEPSHPYLPQKRAEGDGIVVVLPEKVLHRREGTQHSVFQQVFAYQAKPLGRVLPKLCNAI